VTALLDTLAMAFATLRANVLRSALTLLGIVIGASTVVAMMSLTEGFRLKMTSDFAMLGAGAFQVQKWPHMSFGPRDWRKYERRADLTREQGEALRDLPHVAWVSIEEYHRQPEALATRERATKQNVTVAGGLPDFLGPDVTDVLFPGVDPLGQEVRIRGVPFEIVGVAQRQGAILGQSKDGYAVIPWPSFERVLGKARNTNIAIVATTPEDAPQALEEVIAKLRRVRGVPPQDENDFEIFSNETTGEMFDNLARMVGAATFGVCALALLVGGIGIMNIMLVSVSERTREIGIRKALGARRRRILSQFLVESVTLSALGGLAGVLLGGGLAIGAREIWQVPASIPAWAVILSLATSGGAGLLFGIYPAARASKLDPVEAMRTE
jgi:putative ABC transport system permease protein